MFDSGAILTGDKILKEYKAGKITINDFNKEQLNPNSYNLRIGDKFIQYVNVKEFDLKKPETYSTSYEVNIDPVNGTLLYPGSLYLIPTEEVIGSDYYVPIITGRSSIGRLGIMVHSEAGFGDLGFIGKWVLQVKVTYPTRVYPGIQMAQMYFLKACGSNVIKYEGNYKSGAVTSKFNFK